MTARSAATRTSVSRRGGTRWVEWEATLRRALVLQVDVERLWREVHQQDGHLQGQLAGRRQDQDPGAFLSGRAAFERHRDRRNAERQRLSKHDLAKPDLIACQTTETRLRVGLQRAQRPLLTQQDQLPQQYFWHRKPHPQARQFLALLGPSHGSRPMNRSLADELQHSWQYLRHA